MKVLLITDQHFGARNDSQAFLDYYELFYSQIVIPYIDQNNITTVIDLGDTFDRRKYVNFATLERAKKMWFDPLAERGITVHTLVGNHDTYYKNTNEINSPNLLLGDYKNIITYSEAEVVEFDGTPIAMLPWICSGNYAQSLNFIQTAKADILMGHLELSGFAMMKGIENDHGMDKSLFNRYDTVFTGHYHHKSDDGRIHYLGNPYELTWSDYNDYRGFHVFDTSSRNLEFIRNPYRMFHKVFYNDSAVEEYAELELDKEKLLEYNGKNIKVVVQSKNNPYWFDMFVDEIYKVNPTQLSIVEDHGNMSELDDDDMINEAEDTLTILEKYIDGLEIDADKKRLNSLMRTLYQEAMNVESA
jgi:DNA repair exonuclease SbcCD nuclease subunit